MKPLIKRILTCLALLLAAPVTLCLLTFGIPAQYTETFLGELPHKADALAEAEGNSTRINLGGKYDE